MNELDRCTAKMHDAASSLKTYFAEESKAGVDECLARWSSFLGQVHSMPPKPPPRVTTQVDRAVSYHNEDVERKRRSSRR